MRTTVLIAGLILIFSGCKKDKYTTAPQITYKKIDPNALRSDLSTDQQQSPILTIGITDLEGDFGFDEGKDTSYVYIKNLLSGRFDSVYFPSAVNSATGKNFEAEVKISLVNFVQPSGRPAPKVDTTYFEVYVTDYAKNKSNVIVTKDPLFYITP